MTNSAWLQSKGKAQEAPLQTSWDDAYATQSYDLSKATNDDIDELNADKDRYFNMLIEQYNHMFKVQEQRPQQLLDLTSTGLKVKKQADQWLEFEKRMNKWYDAMGKASEADATWTDPNGNSQDDKHLALAARFDKDVAKDLEIQQQQDEIEVEVHDAGYAALDEGRVELAQEILRTGEMDASYWRDADNVLLDEDRYFQAAAANLKVAMPGYTNADGSQRYMTLQDAHTIGEKRFILGKIMNHYMFTVSQLQGRRPGRFKRSIAKPLMERYEARLKSQYSDVAKAQLEVNERLRAEELETQLSNNPNNFIHWMNKHKGAYNGSYREARLHGARIIAKAASTGGMSRATIEDLLDHEFIAHDKTKQTVRDYWQKESSIMLKGIGDFEKETMEAETRERKQAVSAEFMQIKKEFDDRDVPPTQEERQQIRTQLMTKHNISAEQLPDEIKNWYAQGDGEDEALDYELTKRLNRGETLTSADLGFNDPFKKAEWLKKIAGSGGMDTNRRDSFIIGKVDWKTQNTLGEDGRGDEWRAYQDNATLEFNRAFLLAKANGASNSEAMKAGMDAVVDGLTKDDSWSKWGGTAQDPNSITSLGKARIAVGKDRTLLDSDKPWIGEDPHLENAVKYLQGKSTSIPQYYRNFPNIKLQPIQLMKRRLTALGLLKDGELVLPEEEIRPDLQNMFIKPSPARTYRVITDEDQGPDWVIKQYNDGSREGDEILDIMLQNIRRQSQKAQRFSTTDIAYRNTVEIPPELNEEFVAQVGELPTYLQLANLQPEVAKALVADTLMT